MMTGDLTDYQIQVNSANRELAIRYYRLLEIWLAENDFRHSYIDAVKLIQLCDYIVSVPLTDISPDKGSRWIGYIQAELIREQIITIDSERDFTRPMFHKIYKNFNHFQPTIDTTKGN